MTQTKPFWASKTLWGALITATSFFLVNAGVVQASVLTTLGQALGGFWTLLGLRDGLNSGVQLASVVTTTPN
jgi:hypothetical protein